MNRRNFLQSIPALAIAINSCVPERKRKPRILLRSSWQTFNIGDIAHTPGVLRLLEEHLPDADVCLWASDTGNGVREMLMSRFPHVPIVQNPDEVNAAIKDADFLLHGSGPYLVAESDVKRWREETGKPYGVFGISLSRVDESVRDLLTNAEFVFFRDSVSLRFARNNGVQCQIMEFGPDGAFAVDLRNDKAAEDFLSAHNLETGKYICCIPHYRYTPYWRFKNRPLDRSRQQRNEEMKEHDHAPLRDAVAEVIRSTDMKILLCPEDMTHMAIGREMIFDKLPEDVKTRVVWRESFWLTDEAVSTYVRSAGLFGLDMHSPIMCIGNGVPAIVCRFEEQTSKGFMWQDIGLDDWLFDMDKTEQIKRLVPTVLDMVESPDASETKAEQARKKVNELQRGMVARLSTVLK